MQQPTLARIGTARTPPLRATPSPPGLLRELMADDCSKLLRASPQAWVQALQGLLLHKLRAQRHAPAVGGGQAAWQGAGGQRGLGEERARVEQQAAGGPREGGGADQGLEGGWGELGGASSSSSGSSGSSALESGPVALSTLRHDVMEAIGSLLGATSSHLEVGRRFPLRCLQRALVLVHVHCLCCQSFLAQATGIPLPSSLGLGWAHLRAIGHLPCHHLCHPGRRINEIKMRCNLRRGAGNAVPPAPAAHAARHSRHGGRLPRPAGARQPGRVQGALTALLPKGCGGAPAPAPPCTVA